MVLSLLSVTGERKRPGSFSGSPARGGQQNCRGNALTDQQNQPLPPAQCRSQTLTELINLTEIKGSKLELKHRPSSWVLALTRALSPSCLWLWILPAASPQYLCKLCLSLREVTWLWLCWHAVGAGIIPCPTTGSGTRAGPCSDTRVPAFNAEGFLTSQILQHFRSTCGNTFCQPNQPCFTMR